MAATHAGVATSPMLALLAAIPLSYHFGAGKTVGYDMDVRFEGYVQVFGGRDTDVQAKMLVEVTGLATDAEGHPQASSEIKELKLSIAGSELPIAPANLERYFPKTTISFSPEGKVLKSDAPDAKLPVRLPALDPKRFPDISYLPLQFPAEGVEVGKEFSFQKPFGDSIVTFRVTPREITDEAVQFAVKMSQSYVQFEDKYGNPADEAHATTKVDTTVAGEGEATFDRRRGLVSRLKVVADALSKAVEIATQITSERKLRTTLSIRTREEKQ